MTRGLWSRLNLRWQAAVAVLLPCTGVALFAAVYFPHRMNAQAEEALLRRAQTLGALASAAAAPTLKLIGDGLARPEELDPVLEGALGGAGASPGKKSGAVTLEGSELLYLAVLKGKSRSLTAHPETVVRQAVQARAKGDFAGTSFEVPRANRCELDNGEQLRIRCYVKDAAPDSLEGLFVASLDKSTLRATQSRNVQVGLWTAVGAAGVGLLLAFLFSGKLAGPMQRVTDAARNVAEGDVTVPPVEADAGGELGSMARSFNEMLASLRSLVGQMVSLTGQLAQAAQELQSASGEQGDLSSRQATHAQDIGATFEELTRTAERISASTDTVDGSARRTQEAVEGARAVFGQLITDISATRTESKAVADSIQALNTELRQVAKIAQLINSFAERSDLLALNAALEGTKAGDVGRGFSLVAVELRRLAENVGGSAKDIGRIVEQVETSGGQALQQARLGVITSDKRAEMASKAARLFDEISARVRSTTEAAQEISVATREQRRASEQAAEGARTVSELVKQGVDATQRTQEIARQLSGVAQALSQVTRRFKVE